MMKRLGRAGWLLLGAGVLAAGGCRSGGPVPAESTADRAPAPAGWPQDIRAQPIFDGGSGERMTWDGLIAAASGADAVIIGEMHGHERGLGVAAALFEDVLRRCPNTAALSLEFFERDEQMAMDDYLTGVTDEDAFHKAANRTEGNYPTGHRAMVEAARGAGRPVIASNAPRRYVRLARTDGFEKLASLTEEQRRMYSIPESLTTGGYRDRFYELMGGMAGSPGHGGEGDDATGEQAPADADAMITPIFRSQNVWDATMAESISRAIAAGDHPVVQVVGQFHCDSDGGLVQRLRAMNPRARVLVVSMSGAWSRELTDEDRGRADVVVYVGE